MIDLDSIDKQPFESLSNSILDLLSESKIDPRLYWGVLVCISINVAMQVNLKKKDMLSLIEKCYDNEAEKYK